MALAEAPRIYSRNLMNILEVLAVLDITLEKRGTNYQGQLQ